jgi:hypothetical protein
VDTCKSEKRCCVAHTTELSIAATEAHSPRRERKLDCERAQHEESTMSESFLLAAAARSLDVMIAQPTNDADVSTLLGDKSHIWRTLVQHIVKTILADFPGKSFAELDILELGSGDGFFAKSYSEMWPEEPTLERLLQTDAHPRDGQVCKLDVCELASSLAGRRFDAVLCVDFVSCLPFGAGLDPDDEDDVDALSALHHGLANVLKDDGIMYDFMASMPNSQFVCRYVPDFCQQHPDRFICVYDDSHEATKDAQEGEGDDNKLMFVTFSTDLMRHEEGTAGAPVLLHLAGRPLPITYEALCEALKLKKAKSKKRELKNLAFSKKVLEFLFRDVNTGGCPDNWELMSYVMVDPAHFEDVFEEPPERMVPVFQETLGKAVRFLRASFKPCESYEEITLLEAFKAVVLRHFTGFEVDFAEAGLVGADNGRYKQAYHYARVQQDTSCSAPSGSGSCRCLVTRACRRGKN